LNKEDELPASWERVDDKKDYTMDTDLKASIANGFRNTPLGFLRIRKNLNITHFSDVETEEYLKDILLSTPLEDIETKGKNHYFRCVEREAVLTVNSHSFTIITAKTIIHPAIILD
jgi:hypothetical protein